MLSPHPLCRFSALIRECLFASAAARLLSLALAPSALRAAQRIRRSAGAELVGSLGLLKVPARDLKRALEEVAAVRADPPQHRTVSSGVESVVKHLAAPVTTLKRI